MDSIILKNWSGLFLPIAFIIALPLHIYYLMIEIAITEGVSSGWVLGFAVTTVLFLFSLELLWQTFTSMELSNETIQFRKPWKRFGFFRKRRSTWILNNADWNEMYIFKQKSAYTLYFSKDKTAIFFATIEYGGSFVKAIEKNYPEKKVFRHIKEFPRALRKELKKEFPERVMTG